MKEFVLYIVKNLVEKPASAAVTMREEGEVLYFEISVDAGDAARVVGRKGRNIQSLRTLATAVAARFGRKARLNLADELATVEKREGAAEEIANPV